MISTSTKKQKCTRQYSYIHAVMSRFNTCSFIHVHSNDANHAIAHLLDLLVRRKHEWANK